MPVFLIPIVAGGYYYYWQMKEKVRGEPLQGHPQTPQEDDETPDLASSSIEVSLVSSSLQDTGELRTMLEEYESCAQNRQLRRQWSADTGNTEVSFDEEVEVTAEPVGGVPGVTCGGCDQDNLIAMVKECGNRCRLETRIFS